MLGKSLLVFAKRTDDIHFAAIKAQYSMSVSQLTKAIAINLQMSESPTKVSLLLEGSPKDALVSTDFLYEADQGNPLRDGVKLIVSIPPPFVPPYDAASLSKRAQKMVIDSAAMRKVLADVPVLASIGDCMRADKAAELGVSIFSEPGAAMVGSFSLPDFEYGKLLETPRGVFIALLFDCVYRANCCLIKGYDGIVKRPFILHKSRVDLVSEFLGRMRNPKVGDNGVLLSGPNGVGKSAVGLLTTLACSAAGKFNIYVSSAIEWVGEAEDGFGDRYLLDLFVTQNADLIVSSDALWPVFAAHFRGEEDTGPAMMNRLKEALVNNHKTVIGLIVDEVQAITKAVESPDKFRSSTYYAVNWYNWQCHYGSMFNRMEIATSHGKKLCTHSVYFYRRLYRCS